MTPIMDRVIIKPDAKDEKKGSIFLAPGAQQEKPKGVVVGVGPKVHDVKVGDYVLFNVNYRQTFPEDGVEYVIVNEPDVLAILNAVTQAEMPTVR